MTKLTLIFFAIFSLVGCSIARPKGLVCIAHISDASKYNHCFDMEKDFSDKGELLPGHPGVKIPLVMDKHVNLDPDSYAELSAYWQKLVKRYENCK